MGQRLKTNKKVLSQKKNETWTKALPKKVVNLDIKSTILWIT
jgi:hypothetical protein